MHSFESNPQLELAHDFVCNTDKNIFLTGKAGTGKTTFLHRIKAEAVKRMVVVAPTGVAAINAGGMTIHSFFQLPFGPQVPGMESAEAKQRRFSGKKIGLMKSLDLLVIDEISMVRADLLDGIDSVLRRYRDYSQPFGGVQLLMIGDLNQLPPVVKNNEWELLRTHYQTPYFFGSLALQKSDPVTIELKHIYRQSDSQFIRLLNKVRDNNLDQEVLAALNSRYRDDFVPSEKDGYITLTAHNAVAQRINQERLAFIAGDLQQFRAKTTGDFPAHAYPTDEMLELKTGAQVMFVKNDPSPEKFFYNGKIGQVTRFDDDLIFVKCPDDPDEIAVSSLDWNNVKYTLNETNKEVEEEVVGTFTQYPLKLAWAITIHKSQGLTFERAIIDAEAAFAHGQVYVALSRCKTFEGIVLRSKISYGSVKTDTVVKRYNEEAEQNAPDEAALEQSKLEYQQKLILELFDYQPVQRAIGQFKRVLMEQAGAFQESLVGQLDAQLNQADTELFAIAKKFLPSLHGYFRQVGLPEGNTDLQERLKKACSYFLEKVNKGLWSWASAVQILTDNQAAGKKAQERLGQIKKELLVKKNCLTASEKGFTTGAYIRAKADADLDISAGKKGPTKHGSALGIPGASPHPDLYIRLAKWREEVATKAGISNYEVIPVRSMLDITRTLPTSTATLKEVRGFGDVKIKRYGGEVLQIVESFVKEKKIPTNMLDLSTSVNKTSKEDTKHISFKLFQSGKTIDEIAAERGFVRTTIEGHLSHFISSGELDIYKVIDKEKVAELIDFHKDKDLQSSTVAKEHFGEKYSYGEIRMVLQYMVRRDEG